MTALNLTEEQEEFGIKAAASMSMAFLAMNVGPDAAATLVSSLLVAQMNAPIELQPKEMSIFLAKNPNVFDDFEDFVAKFLVDYREKGII